MCDIYRTILIVNGPTVMDGHTFTIHPCDAGCKNCKNTACIDYPKLEKHLAMGREERRNNIQDTG